MVWRGKRKYAVIRDKRWNTKGYPDPIAQSRMGPPNKSFVIIDLIEINTAPEVAAT
jgi:hypothetical protein